MSSVAEIEAAIEQLPPDDKLQLRDWLVRQCPELDDDILVPRSYQQKVLDVLDEP
jgi:hypothetical protein